MKKKRYRLKVETSKKQKISLAIAFGSIFILYAIYLSIPDPADWLSISFLIVIFGILITNCVIILNDNAKLVKKARADVDAKQAEEKRISVEIFKAFNEYLSTDSRTLPQEKRLIYVLLALFDAAVQEKVLIFHADCCHFTDEELKNLLKDVKFTKDFRKFIDEIILEKKETASISRHIYELELLLKEYLLNLKTEDAFLYDDTTIFNETKQMRIHYEYDEKKRKYIVHADVYTDFHGYYQWEPVFKYSFKREEKAQEKCLKVAKKYKCKRKNYSSVSDLDMQELAKMILRRPTC